MHFPKIYQKNPLTVQNKAGVPAANAIPAMRTGLLPMKGIIPNNGSKGRMAAKQKTHQ